MKQSAQKNPPAWHNVEAHDMFPDHSHDDIARFNYISTMNRYLSQTLGEGNSLTYQKNVLPKLTKSLQRPPKNRHEIRTAMNDDPFHAFWSAAKRNTMEQRQQISRAMVLPQAQELSDRAKSLTAAHKNLELDPSLELPAYISSVDHHCMPGSYHTELFDGDVSPGANYDSGMFATTGGAMGPLSDAAGQAVVSWMKENHPSFQPKRILEIGCTIGHTLLPVASAFPEASVTGVDVAAPVLRYGAARAASLGVNNVTFVQADGEDLSRYADASFDFIYSAMFLHETSSRAMVNVMREAHRLLKPGGLTLHLEQPSYTPDMPLYEQFIRDWDSHNNNEPFWSTLHDTSIKDVMSDVGFCPSEMFSADVAAQPQSTLKREDHGRASAWHAYGAWKGY